MPRLLAFSLLLVLVFIAATGKTHGQVISQGFDSDSPLQRGLIVRLNPNDSSKVEPLDSASAEQMYGVVVTANDAPVTLSREGQQVFVATSGQHEVLVSNQNGQPKIGDYITISSIQGVGMKAGDEAPVIVGRALEDYDSSTEIISSAAVGDRRVDLVRLKTDITVARNPLKKPETNNLPEFLKSLAETIAGRPVSPVRVYVGLVVFFMSAVIAGSMLYSGVHSSIISIGRNPLSKTSIMRGMIQVIITSLLIFLSGVLGVYLILRL